MKTGVDQETDTTLVDREMTPEKGGTLGRTQHTTEKDGIRDAAGMIQGIVGTGLSTLTHEIGLRLEEDETPAKDRTIGLARPGHS